MTVPFRILDRLRAGRPLGREEMASVAAGATDGSWSDAQLGAFLMGVAIRGLEAETTGALIEAMIASGESWDLAADVPGLTDKHSTGGVADTVSLVLAPLLGCCGVPVAMLTGRGLGHTGGTTDKLESIPGLTLHLGRDDCLRLLADHACAVGTSTAEIAPADRKLYSLRDVTATIRSLPLITASILSKKIATGAEVLVFDVKTGDGAFLQEADAAHQLAHDLVDTCAALGRKAVALLTDMNQPLGEWAGHACEVRATLECLEGGGSADLMEVTYRLGEEMAKLGGHEVTRADLEEAIASGKAREHFDRWAEAQGAEVRWLANPVCELAPEEYVLTAERAGVLAKVETRQLGLLLAEAGGGRAAGGEEIDFGVSLRSVARLGDEVAKGDELGRVYLRAPDEGLAERFRACFVVAEEGEAPALVYERVG